MLQTGDLARDITCNNSINYLTTMNSINRKHLHDHFFRESMTRVAISKGVLFTFTYPLILKTIDFSTFEIVKDDWISEKLKESRSDILYRAKQRIENQWIYFLGTPYLFVGSPTDNS